MSDCITTLIVIVIIALLLGDNRDCDRRNRSSNDSCGSICGGCGR